MSVCSAMMNLKILQIEICMKSTTVQIENLMDSKIEQIGIKVDPKETKIEHLMQFKIVQIGNLMDSKIVQMKKVNVCMSFCLYKYDAPQ